MYFSSLLRPLCGAALIACLCTACSTQQLYGVGQSWQREQCERIQSSQERGRCLGSTAISYEEYQREAAAAEGDR